MMTFEEFKELALNPPKKNDETIFEVEGFTIDENQGRKPGQLYPKFHLEKYLIGFSHTIDDSEKLIFDFIDMMKKMISVPYCFYVKEYPLNENLQYFSDGYALSMRLYDSKGNFLDKTYCSALIKDFRTEYGVFRGRESDKLRFKEGDVIEVREGDIVQLGIIASPMLTIDKCWELRNNKNNSSLFSRDHNIILSDQELDKYYNVDPGDDQCLVIKGPGYEINNHVHTLNILPLHYPLPDKLRKRYERYYQEMLIEEAKIKEQEANEKIRIEKIEKQILLWCDEIISSLEKINPVVALSKLMDCYIAFCGISISLRTIAHDAAEYWMNQLANSEHLLSNDIKGKTFLEFIPRIYPEIEPLIDHYAGYDIANLYKEEVIESMDEFIESVSDNETKVALAYGFKYLLTNNIYRS